MVTTKDVFEFLRRTQKFIKLNKDLILAKKDKAPLSYSQVVDAIEEKIETYLSEVDTEEPSE
ncbi:hypothetical protein ES703_02134 [subsurface metagenome]